VSDYRLIEYEDGGNFHLGLELVSQVNKGKIPIIDRKGIEKRINGSKISIRLEQRLTGGVINLVSWLTPYSEEVKNLENSIDLETLWELLFEDGGFYSLKDLCDLYFDSKKDEEVLALFRKLRNDNYYFKNKKGEYEPKNPEQVKKIKEQYEAIIRKENEKKLFVENVINIVKAKEDKQLLITQLQEIDGSLKYIDQIRKLAVYGESFPKWSSYLDLIRPVLENCRIKSNPPELAAFELGVHLNIFTEHENLPLLKFNPPLSYDNSILDDLKVWNAESDDSTREDFTHFEIFTIDDDETRDIDDGLSVLKIENGYLIGVHIADPFSIIKPGSNMDLEARKRGTSIYLPEKTINMLPRLLSENNLSLVKGEIRPALSFMGKFDENGELYDSYVVRSLIEVKHRLNYKLVDEILENNNGNSSSLVNNIKVLFNIVNVLTKNRENNGAIEINLPETKVFVDGEFNIDLVHLDRLSKARTLVSEMMIFANVSAGEYAKNNNIPVIYRVQAPPREKIEFDKTSLIDCFKMVKNLKKGEFSSKPLCHNGLGVNVYLQVSSPLRRYSDLVAHYQIISHLKGKNTPFNADEVLKILGNCEAITVEAKNVERSRNRYWTLKYLKQNKNTELNGIVLEKFENNPSKGFVFLNLTRQKLGAGFNRKVEIGEEIDLKVIKIDPRRNEVILNLM
jgi:exoribonuclease II